MAMIYEYDGRLRLDSIEKMRHLILPIHPPSPSSIHPLVALLVMVGPSSLASSRLGLAYALALSLPRSFGHFANPVP